MRVCFNNEVIEVRFSRERAFSLVSKLGEGAYVEFYDKQGVFDRILYHTVMEIAKIQTPELIKKKKKHPKYPILFCKRCYKPKPAYMFYAGKCGDCNNIIFI